MPLRKLPPEVRTSEILTGADILKLGKIEAVPSDEEVQAFSLEPEVSAILEAFDEDDKNKLHELHKLARTFIEEGEVAKAWKTILQ